MSQFTQVEFRDEIRSAEVEPLLPIEKKLIGFSLGLGIVLLVVLAAINHLYAL
jgi:hypothetical protein